MRNVILISVFLAIFGMFSCSQKHDYGLPTTDFKSIERDFTKWWTYHSNNISLSSDFIPVDNHSKKISKEEFLKNLTSGEFIPLKLSSKDNNTCYQLFKLDQQADEQIRSTIQNTAFTSYKYFRMEGKYFPKFNFTDLNGTEFNNDNTKGKIVIIKCWFIKCAPCVAEFPVLNDFAEKNGGRKDLVFISLAFDQKDELNEFLLKNPFKYAVIADQRQFMSNDLKITAYPTHIILGRDGKILKVTNKADEMMNAFQKLDHLEEKN